MGIYQRDNINYGGMLGNAMRDRANYLANKRALEVQNAQNWGNAIQKSGQAVGDALNKYAYTKWGYDQDMNKLEAQQGFQKDMKEMELREALKRAREQQNWQATQNDLNRQNTYDIAEMNHNAGIVKQAEEKQIKNKLDYDLAKSMLPLINDKLKYTENPSDKILLEERRVKYQNAIDNYEKLYGKPEVVPEFSQEFLNEATGAKPAGNSTTPVADWYGQFGSGYKNYKTNALDANIAIRDDLKAKLNDADFKNAFLQIHGTDKWSELNKALTDLDTQIKQQQASIAFKKKAQASYDAIPKMANGEPKPGSLAKWKGNNPKYAKALGL